MGMTHVKEEYKLNRIRGLTQMVETEDRQAGQAASTMDTEKNTERPEKRTPIPANSKEMKDILKEELHIEVEESTEDMNHGKGNRAKQARTQPTQAKEGKWTKARELQATSITVEDTDIPAHLVTSWNKQEKGTKKQ